MHGRLRVGFSFWNTDKDMTDERKDEEMKSFFVTAWISNDTFDNQDQSFDFLFK